MLLLGNLALRLAPLCKERALEDEVFYMEPMLEDVSDC